MNTLELAKDVAELCEKHNINHEDIAVMVKSDKCYEIMDLSILDSEKILSDKMETVYSLVSKNVKGKVTFFKDRLFLFCDFENYITTRLTFKNIEGRLKNGESPESLASYIVNRYKEVILSKFIK